MNTSLNLGTGGGLGSSIVNSSSGSGSKPLATTTRVTPLSSAVPCVELSSEELRRITSFYAAEHAAGGASLTNPTELRTALRRIDICVDAEVMGELFRRFHTFGEATRRSQLGPYRTVQHVYEKGTAPGISTSLERKPSPLPQQCGQAQVTTVSSTGTTTTSRGNSRPNSSPSTGATSQQQQRVGAGGVVTPPSPRGRQGSPRSLLPKAGTTALSPLSPLSVREEARPQQILKEKGHNNNNTKNNDKSGTQTYFHTCDGGTRISCACLLSICKAVKVLEAAAASQRIVASLRPTLVMSTQHRNIHNYANSKKHPGDGDDRKSSFSVLSAAVGPNSTERDRSPSPPPATSTVGMYELEAFAAAQALNAEELLEQDLREALGALQPPPIPSDTFRVLSDKSEQQKIVNIATTGSSSPLSSPTALSGGKAVVRDKPHQGGAGGGAALARTNSTANVRKFLGITSSRKSQQGAEDELNTNDAKKLAQYVGLDEDLTGVRLTKPLKLSCLRRRQGSDLARVAGVGGQGVGGADENDDQDLFEEVDGDDDDGPSQQQQQQADDLSVGTTESSDPDLYIDIALIDDETDVVAALIKKINAVRKLRASESAKKAALTEEIYREHVAKANSRGGGGVSDGLIKRGKGAASSPPYISKQTSHSHSTLNKAVLRKGDQSVRMFAVQQVLSSIFDTADTAPTDQLKLPTTTAAGTTNTNSDLSLHTVLQRNNGDGVSVSAGSGGVVGASSLTITTTPTISATKMKLNAFGLLPDPLLYAKLSDEELRDLTSLHSHSGGDGNIIGDDQLTSTKPMVSAISSSSPASTNKGPRQESHELVSSFISSQQDEALFKKRQVAGEQNTLPPSIQHRAVAGNTVNTSNSAPTPTPSAGSRGTGARGGHGQHTHASHTQHAADKDSLEALHTARQKERADLMEDARLLRALLYGDASDDEAQELLAVKALVAAKEQKAVRGTASKLRRLASSSFLRSRGGGGKEVSHAPEHSTATSGTPEGPPNDSLAAGGGPTTAYSSSSSAFSIGALHEAVRGAGDDGLKAIERKAAIQQRLFMTPSKEKNLMDRVRAEHESAVKAEMVRRREAEASRRNKARSLSARQIADRETIRALRTRRRSMVQLKGEEDAEENDETANFVVSSADDVDLLERSERASQVSDGIGRSNQVATITTAAPTTANTSFGEDSLLGGVSDTEDNDSFAFVSEMRKEAAALQSGANTLRTVSGLSLRGGAAGDGVGGGDLAASRRKRRVSKHNPQTDPTSNSSSTPTTATDGGGAGGGGFLTAEELAALRRLSEERAKEEHPLYTELKSAIERYAAKQQQLEERAGLFTARSGAVSNNNATTKPSSSPLYQSLSSHLLVSDNERLASVHAQAEGQTSLYKPKRSETRRGEESPNHHSTSFIAANRGGETTPNFHSSLLLSLRASSPTQPNSPITITREDESDCAVHTARPAKNTPVNATSGEGEKERPTSKSSAAEGHSATLQPTPSVSLTPEMLPYGIRRPANGGSFPENEERWSRMREEEHRRVLAGEEQRSIDLAHTKRLEAAFEACEMPYESFIYTPQLRHRPKQVPIYIQNSFTSSATAGMAEAAVSNLSNDDAADSKNKKASSGGALSSPPVMMKRLPYLTKTAAAANKGAPLVGSDHKVYPHSFLVVPTHMKRPMSPPSQTPKSRHHTLHRGEESDGSTSVARNKKKNLGIHAGPDGIAASSSFSISSAFITNTSVATINGPHQSHYESEAYKKNYDDGSRQVVPLAEKGGSLKASTAIINARMKSGSSVLQNGKGNATDLHAHLSQEASRHIRARGREDPRIGPASVEFARKGGAVYSSSAASISTATTSIGEGANFNPTLTSLKARAASASGIVRGPGCGSGSGVMYYGGHTVVMRPATSLGFSDKNSASAQQPLTRVSLASVAQQQRPSTAAAVINTSSASNSNSPHSRKKGSTNASGPPLELKSPVDEAREAHGNVDTATATKQKGNKKCNNSRGSSGAENEKRRLSPEKALRGEGRGPSVSMHGGHNHQPSSATPSSAHVGVGGDGSIGSSSPESFYASRLRRTSELLDYTPAFLELQEMQQNQPDVGINGVDKEGEGGGGAYSQGSTLFSDANPAEMALNSILRKKEERDDTSGSGTDTVPQTAALGSGSRHTASRSPLMRSRSPPPVGTTPWDGSFYMTNSMRIKGGAGGARRRNNSVFDIAGGHTWELRAPRSPTKSAKKKSNSNNKSQVGSEGANGSVYGVSPFEQLERKISPKLSPPKLSVSPSFSLYTPSSLQNHKRSVSHSANNPQLRGSTSIISQSPAAATISAAVGGSGGMLAASYYQSQHSEIGARLRELQQAREKLRAREGGSGDRVEAEEEEESTAASPTKKKVVGRKDLKKEVEGLLDRFLTDNRDEKFVPWKA